MVFHDALGTNTLAAIPTDTDNVFNWIGQSALYLNGLDSSLLIQRIYNMTAKLSYSAEISTTAVIPDDPATTAWVAAVVTAGGTVSAERKEVINALAVGLKADALFTKLDRLWLFAAENQISALVDIIANVLATAPSSPTFTVDLGFTGNGASTGTVSTGFNPFPGGFNFTQNSGCGFGWDNTGGADIAPMFDNGGGSRLYPNYLGTSYWRINDGSDHNFVVASAPKGLYLANRDGASSMQLDVNGGQVDSSTDASIAVANSTFIALGDPSVNYGTRQQSCVGFGGGLTGTDRINLYNRLRTYMSAVGVP